MDTGGATHAYTTRPSLDAIEAVLGPIRRRREPVTDARLREFAEAFPSNYQKGRSAAFAESQFLSERQMWRMVKLARDRGFLPRKGDDK